MKRCERTWASRIVPRDVGRGYLDLYEVTWPYTSRLGDGEGRGLWLIQNQYA